MWRKMLMLIVLMIIVTMIAGCSVGFAVGADADLYWPKIKTAQGGSFGDPESSRQQATRHTTSISRNNLPMVGE